MNKKTSHFFIIMIVLISCLLPHLSDTQLSFQLGLKLGGLRSTVMSDDQAISATERIESTSLRPRGDIGWNFAISSFIEKELMVGNIYLQPEISFNKSSGVIRYFTDPGGSGETLVNLDENFKNLNFPVVLGYRFLFLRVFAGPILSVLLDADSRTLYLCVKATSRHRHDRRSEI